MTDERRPENDYLPQVYDRLRAIAQRYMARHPQQTLQPTALVHEAFLQLNRKDDRDWRDDSHVLATAAKAMRDILVDAARRRCADKRGGDKERITLTDGLAGGTEQPIDLLILDEALTQLAEVDPRMARVVELKMFAGLNGDAIAAALGVSRKTVVRILNGAKLWLLRSIDTRAPETDA